MRALFYGLGADGTVGANKNSIKIIGEDTDNYAQGYFVYDSKKSGVGDRLAPALRPEADPLHLPGIARPISSPATSPVFLERYDMLKDAVPGGTFLLNSPYGTDEVWDQLAAHGAGTDHRQES